MSKTPSLDEVLEQARRGQEQTDQQPDLSALSGRIMAQINVAPTKSATSRRLNGFWRWLAQFSQQPLRLAATALVPLLLGFIAGDLTIDSERQLLNQLSAQNNADYQLLSSEDNWSQLSGAVDD